MFNLGGPGWFADVLNITIDLQGPRIEEDGESYIIPWHPYKGSVIMCDVASKISGRVIITAPAPHKIWHYGVKVQIEEYAHFTDPFVSTDYITYEEKIANEGYIVGSTEFNFEIDLLKSNACWHESYNGKSFGLKHTLTVTVQRPWYTFNCVTYEPIRMYKIQPPPESFAANNEEPHHLIPITDCGGEVMLDIFSPHIEIRGTLRAKLYFKGLPSPLMMAQIVLLRGEYVDNEVTEGIVFVHTVFGAGSSALASEAAKEEGYVTISKGFTSRIEIALPGNSIQNDNDNNGSTPPTTGSTGSTVVSTPTLADDPVRTDTMFEVDIPIYTDNIDIPTDSFKAIELSPTFTLDPNMLTVEDSSDDKRASGGLCAPRLKPSDKEALALKYYLRIIVQDVEENDFWNTSEVFLYRTSLPLESPASLTDININV